MTSPKVQIQIKNLVVFIKIRYGQRASVTVTRDELLEC